MFNDLPARYLSELAVETRSNCLLRQPVIGARMSLAELMCFALNGATHDDLDTLASYPMVTKRVHAGRLLVTCSQSLDSLYVVLGGAFVSMFGDDVGSQRVVAFPMPGDIIGLDALPNGRHQTASVSLSEGTVAVLPWHELSQICRSAPALGEALASAAAIALEQRQEAMNMLGAMGAEVRLARFLLRLGQRYGRLGYSLRCFTLPMSRREIASYLGVTMETICRAFTALVNLGYLRVDGRSIELLDVDALHASGEQAARRNRFGLTPHQRRRRMRSRDEAAGACPASQPADVQPKRQTHRPAGRIQSQEEKQ